MPTTRERGRSRDISPIALARIANRTGPVHFCGVSQSRSQPHNLAQSTSYIQPILQDPSHSIAVVNDDHSLFLPDAIPLTSEGCVSSDSESCASSTAPSRAPSPECDPPLSVEDQMQRAYALDDMHLAKILYLKIQGIEVSSDDDPRIEAVTDDDFCFVPEGAISLTEEDVRRVQEMERNFQDEWEKRRREERLRICERVWEEEARRVRKEKLQILKAREEAAALEEKRRASMKMKIREEREREMAAKLEDRQRYSLSGPSTSRMILALAQATVPAKQVEVAFEYEVPFKPSTSSSLWQRPTAAPSASTTSVSFREVIKSMHGDLFPVDAADAGQPRRNRQIGLLDGLLRRDVPANGGRDAEANTRPRSRICVACSASSLSRTTSSSSISSAESASTAPTSPGTSPTNPGPFKSPALPPLSLELIMVHSCRRSAHVPVPLADSPLAPPAPAPRPAVQLTHASLELHSQPLVKRVPKSVVVQLAAKFQSAYARAIVFSMPPTPLTDSPHRFISSPNNKSAAPPPHGYRACANDVRLFTSTPRSASPPPTQYIPLSSPYRSPPPPLVFPPLPYLPPSPLRPRQPPAQPQWRTRPVANPAALRLRAAQNVVGARGGVCDGTAIGRVGMRNCGRERLMGVAFDGIGRSALGCEVRVVF